MILVSDDDSFTSRDFHSNWYEVKDLNVKIRKKTKHGL